jgi:hypothetical protein
MKLLVLVVVVRIIDWALELMKSMYARLAGSWQGARWCERRYSAVYAIGNSIALQILSKTEMKTHVKIHVKVHVKKYVKTHVKVEAGESEDAT